MSRFVIPAANLARIAHSQYQPVAQARASQALSLASASCWYGRLPIMCLTIGAWLAMGSNPWWSSRTVCAADGSQFVLHEDGQGVTVEWDGQLFCQYRVDDGAKPVIWPLIGPTGHNQLRGYPFEDAADGEPLDHPHHRGLWFGHSNINGVNFWEEEGRHGRVSHRAFTRLHGGDTGLIVASSDWLDASGLRIASDVRTISFGASPDRRWLDFDITLSAADQPLKLDNTKDGLFALRIAHPLSVDAGTGARIVNSGGDLDRAAWGTSASWVDYSGRLDGQACGVAILIHPSSFRFPNRWHVRTYGLFAVNPFGDRFYRNQANLDASHEIPAGQSLSFFFRVLLHRGDALSGHVAEAFTEYARLVKPSTTVSP